MKAVEDMRLSQSLRATIRSDVGRKRLCLTGFIKGLFSLAHLTPEPVSPFIADLTPGTVHTEDFDEESGSVGIPPVIEMSHLILNNVLATSGSLVVDGKVGSNDNICLVFSFFFRWHQPIITQASNVWHFAMNGCTVSTN